MTQSNIFVGRNTNAHPFKSIRMTKKTSKNAVKKNGWRHECALWRYEIVGVAILIMSIALMGQNFQSFIAWLGMAFFVAAPLGVLVFKALRHDASNAIFAGAGLFFFAALILFVLRDNGWFDGVGSVPQAICAMGYLMTALLAGTALVIRIWVRLCVYFFGKSESAFEPASTQKH